MKKAKKKTTLLGQTSRIFILISSVLMILSVIFLYFLTNHLLEQEMEEELYSRRFRLENYLKAQNNVIELSPVFEVKEVTKLKPETLKDTLIYDPSQDEKELFRELTSYTNINGRDYQIIVRSMVVESQDISLAILFSFLIIIVIIFLLQYYLSKEWNKKVWRPFFVNLRQMQLFSLKSEKPVVLEDSNILEFSELKEEIFELTSKMASDYRLLKQFTEDVSHELQTPLAIMQAKIENLLNDPKVKKQQFESLSSLQKDIQRLAQLNKKLVLLTKIDNRQFINSQKINLNKLCQENINNFREFTSMKIGFFPETILLIKADKHLIQILCSNLLSNSLKYCSAPGEVAVKITGKEMWVSNSGDHPIEHSEMLFNRFYKEGKGEKSGTGLGLSIVKRICDLYGYELTYNFKDQRHNFIIYFPDAEAQNP